MHRRRGAGEIVDLIDFEQDGIYDVMANNFEAGIRKKMSDIVFRSREEIIQADYFIPGVEEALTKVASEEPGAAGDHNSFWCHSGQSLGGVVDGN